MISAVVSVESGDVRVHIDGVSESAIADELRLTLQIVDEAAGGMAWLGFLVLHQWPLRGFTILHARFVPSTTTTLHPVPRPTQL